MAGLDAGVWVAISDYLDLLPAEPYPVEVYASKCTSVYQHVEDAYQDAAQRLSICIILTRHDVEDARAPGPDSPSSGPIGPFFRL